MQASRVKFRFEADALEVVIGEKEDKSDNKFVGGENRWKYDTFTNWEVDSLYPPAPLSHLRDWKEFSS